MDITVAYVWHTFITSALAVAALQKLKSASWFPWLTSESSTIIKVVFAVIAAITAATGVSYVWDPTAHTLLISGLSWSAIGTALWHFVNQFIAQETAYQATAARAPASK